MDRSVIVPVCPLFDKPQEGAERVDELLWGWPALELERRPDGWVKVLTHYRYKGWARAEQLERAEGWAPDCVVSRSFADLLAGPTVQAPVMATLPRGALVLGCPAGAEEGWRQVTLCDGRHGWMRESALAPYFPSPPACPPEELGRRVCQSALSYLGTQYRWGGKTPWGIDCSGLVFMAWFLNGVCLFRDARMEPGFPARPIPFEARRPGDLLYFPGHVALYLGEDRFVHSTAKAGSDGVVINSLSPHAPDFRQDLKESLLAVGSVLPAP